VAGFKLWTAQHSENWRAREAATDAYYAFLTDPKGLPSKYKNKTADLFSACTDVAKAAIQDNLLQISNKGLRIFEECLQPHICGGDILPK